MPAPFFVIESGAYDDGNPQRLLAALQRRALPHRAVEFSDGADPSLAPAGARLIAYGSLGMVRGLLRSARWSPAAWIDADALCCHTYYLALPDLIFQKRHAFVSWGDLSTRFSELAAHIGSDGKLFIRPDDPWKTFSGRVVDASTFPRWHKQNTACYDIPANTVCVVATPQNIQREWRCVIHRGKVIASSPYIAEGRRAEAGEVPAAVCALAERAAPAFATMPIFTLDVGETTSGLHILEPGSVNASSLYACDIDRVLDAMIAAAQ